MVRLKAFEAYLRHRPRWQQHLAQWLFAALSAVLMGYYLLHPFWTQRQLVRAELQQLAATLPLTAWQLTHRQSVLQQEESEALQKQYQQVFSPAMAEEESGWLSPLLTQTESRLQRWQRLAGKEQAGWRQQSWQVEIIGHYAGLQQLLLALTRQPQLLIVEQVTMEGKPAGEVLLTMTLSRYWPGEEE
ncbi:MAG: hypothetical protein ACRC5A_13330 [Enterobacteriaceae bacterium]